MPTPVLMPKLGESVVEGTVARWCKTPGDSIAKLEVLLEITTDKIDTEIPSPVGGTLLEIVVSEGVTVNAGTVLAYIGDPGERIGMTASATPVAMPENAAAKAPPSPPSVKTKQQNRPTGRDFISPVVARMAAEHKLDLAQLPGSGMGGRITKKDVLTFIEKRDLQMSANAPLMPSPNVATAPAVATPSMVVASDETLEPLSPMRRAIAHHMVQSLQTSAHVTTIFEVDMTAVVHHREAHKQPVAEKGIPLTFTPYFVVAVTRALQQVPEANARFIEEGVLYQQRIHVGIAVALEKGLIVPVLRDADEKNLQGVARKVGELAEAARQGTLSPESVRGGTFTITNHGVSGSLIGTPIINQPQSGILGIGAIQKRAVVHSRSASLLPSADDAMVIRPMCYLSYSFDHRLLDGARADAFVGRVKQVLESWNED